ncbi:hypothetical protein HMPREF9069_01613 [Atopobium sp. oral taxon 810 str. F0209]|nr:hypothetical protein HMPREF9069_01613 [Atopobium sp. oral taxon 810 str. F0209]
MFAEKKQTSCAERMPSAYERVAYLTYAGGKTARTQRTHVYVRLVDVFFAA